MEIVLDKIVNGGQALGTSADGKKVFVWGGLPGEKVEVQITKKKSKYLEGIVERVLEVSPDRVEPVDHASYLSTSPWQIIDFTAEQQLKAQLVNEAFLQHHIDLPTPTEIFSDKVQYHYRNKVEFSWYSDLDAISGRDTLDLAFFRRGSRGKLIVDGTSLAREEINILARTIRDLLRSKNVSARQLKTLLIRCDQSGGRVWQLYLKDNMPGVITAEETSALPAQGGEIIYSNPKSPASVITERLANFGNIVLEDTVLNTPFRYATEGFFQVNIAVYEQALQDMKGWIADDRPTVDMYSGVGTIGLTIGGPNTALVESNEHAVREMQRNITELKKPAVAVLALSENALDHITSDKIIIVDPPRAGLHTNVVERLLDQLPPRIVYLSCNPATQARDVELLLSKYKIVHNKAYNFFPRTPHIENLIVLDKS